MIGPRRRVALAVTTAAFVVLAAGCGSDDDAGGSTETSLATVETTNGTEPPNSAAPATVVDDAPVIEVEAVDYAFENLPASVPSGTRLALTNGANAELHELVAIRLADDETRSVDAIVHLPPQELGAILGAGPPAAVLLAAPGGEQIAAVGDGTLTEPGRYLVFCSIPSGVAPDVYLEAAAAANGEPPQVEGGPPHFAHGMFAELLVE